MEVKNKINVIGKSVKERQQIVKEESKELKLGEVIEVITDDERMPKVAGKMAQMIGTIELIEVIKKDDGFYHGYFRRIELFPLTDVEKGTLIRIARIDGGAQVTKELDNQGIVVGTVAEVAEKKVSHIHSGPLLVKIKGEKLLIPRGIAEKVIVGDRKLLEMEKGERGTINSIKLNEEMIAALSQIGLEEGVEVNIEGHDVEKTYSFKINGSKYVLGDGEAAKILVETGKGIVQSNFLENMGTIKKIIGGKEFLEKLGEEEIINKKIEILSVEEIKSHEGENTGHFVVMKVNGKEIILGKGLAEKIWVRKIIEEEV